MRRGFVRSFLLAALALVLAVAYPALGATRDLGLGFLDHGKAVPDDNGTVEPDRDPRHQGSLVAVLPNGMVYRSLQSAWRHGGLLAWYNPKEDTWHVNGGNDFWKVMQSQGDRLFAASWGSGLQELNPLEPWSFKIKDGHQDNPCTVVSCGLDIGDPRSLLALPDGKTVVLAGYPGDVGSTRWLIFWNRETRISIYVGMQAYLGEQWAVSLAALPDNKMLGGSSVIKQYSNYGNDYKRPVLFIMDVATKSVEWQSVVFHDATEYSQLWTAPSGLVYGIASLTHAEANEETADELRGPKRYFVFDPIQRKVIYSEDLDSLQESSESCDGPRSLVPCGENRLYLLLKKSIRQVDTRTHQLKSRVDSPVQISAGGDWLDGRIYFMSEDRLCSYTPLPEPLP